MCMAIAALISWALKPPRLASALGNASQEGFEGERLLKKMESAKLRNAHRGFDVSVPGDDNDGQLRRSLANGCHQLDTVELWHPDVDDRQVGSHTLDKIQRPAPVSCFGNFKALVGKDPTYGTTNLLLVVHHQNRFHNPPP